MLPRGRSNLSFEDMIRLDFYYIENRSLFLDIKMISKTVRAVLRHEGAYQDVSLDRSRSRAYRGAPGRAEREPTRPHLHRWRPSTADRAAR